VKAGNERGSGGLAPGLGDAESYILTGSVVKMHIHIPPYPYPYPYPGYGKGKIRVSISGIRYGKDMLVDMG